MDSDSLVVFRGHRMRKWLLEQTFEKSCKSTLFGIEEILKFSRHIAESLDLHRALLDLFLLKFDVLVSPTKELVQIEASRDIDPWFELMQRIQQHPYEIQYGHFQIKETNLLDWTKSLCKALYFENENRSGDGSVCTCDATATGKTLQTIPVGEILDMMNESGNAVNGLGTVNIPSEPSDSEPKSEELAGYLSYADKTSS